MQKKTGISRRAFLGGAAAAATFMVVPRHVLAASGQAAPSDKLNIACIGVGGRGRDDLEGVSGENIVALCDVSQDRLGDAAKKFTAAKQFKDFRKMFDEVEKSIDAVTVGTPDHTHAVAVMAAIKRGKHVYSEKPLAHSVGEIRAIMKAARDKKVVTQLGNQGHSSDSIRVFCEWVQDGAIGRVQTIHAGCAMQYSKIGDLGRAKEQHSVPPNLDWDLWLGPAQFRPYNPMYQPGNWRGWLPFGTGVIGDWICHVVDPVFWALDLGSPATIEAQAKGYDPVAYADSCPKGTIIKYTFAAKGKRGPVTLYWYDGDEKLPRPEGLEESRKVPEVGAVVLGDKGGITYGSHGAGGVRIFPEEKMKAYKRPNQTIPRVKGGNHHQDWIDAVKNRSKAGSDFSYGGPLAELALLGVISYRMLGRKLAWDGVRAQFTNCPEANQYLNPPYRAGWTL
jgi:predicted dehydrogenase